MSNSKDLIELEPRMISSKNRQNLRLHNHAFAVNFIERCSINNTQNEQKDHESFNKIHDDERLFPHSTKKQAKAKIQINRNSMTIKWK